MFRAVNQFYWVKTYSGFYNKLLCYCNGKPSNCSTGKPPNGAEGLAVLLPVALGAFYSSPEYTDLEIYDSPAAWPSLRSIYTFPRITRRGSWRRAGEKKKQPHNRSSVFADLAKSSRYTVHKTKRPPRSAAQASNVGRYFLHLCLERIAHLKVAVQAHRQARTEAPSPSRRAR